MKTLNLVQLEEYEMEAMFDGDTLLSYWYQNDAQWRNEYFSPFMAQIGVHVVPLEEGAQYKKCIRKLKALNVD